LAAEQFYFLVHLSQSIDAAGFSYDIIAALIQYESHTDTSIVISIIYVYCIITMQIVLLL